MKKNADKKDSKRIAGLTGKALDVEFQKLFKPLSGIQKEAGERLADNLLAERTKVYGEPMESFTNTGMAWTALLQQHYGITLPHPVPAHVAAQMMLVLKMQRATRIHWPDNYVDAKNFLTFAEDFQRSWK